MSEVEICNLALSHIGKPAINALSEQGASANECNRHYAQARDKVLTKGGFDWRISRRRVALAQVTNDRTAEWGYAYARPADCLSLRAIKDANGLPERGGYEFEQMGSTIYTRVSPAFAIYSRRVTDTATFSPLLVDAIAWELASRIALPLTKDSGLRNNAIEMARASLIEAQVHDANQDNNTYTTETPSLIEARY